MSALPSRDQAPPRGQHTAIGRRGAMILGAGLVPVAASFLNAPAAQAATARTPVSVTDLGAVGNGTTDDTAAVGAAVTGYHTAAGWVECRTPTGR